MTREHPRPRPRSTHLLWATGMVLLLAGIGSALSVALGVHGFARGMLIGAALACVTLGGVVLGLTISKGRRSVAVGDWLPSRDGDA